MEIKLALLADSANVSREGKLNILGVFSNLNAKEFPAVWPSMVLVINLEAHVTEIEREHTIEIKVVDEDGKQLASIEGNFDIKPNKDPKMPSTRGIILPLRDVQFAKPGYYSFDILVDGRYEESIPIHVIQVSR